MRYLSLLSGIEAASVAWEPLGWEPVAFCEIDAFPSAVLAYRFPNVPNLGDITKVDWHEFKERHGTVDVIVGGTVQDQTLIDANEYVVRRLTPRECERLQGFPDDWTKVPYKGKPADECPDSPRYKACGNSMAVPVMRWIGERIQMVEELVSQ